jgi:nucleoid DNA-binding protein
LNTKQLTQLLRKVLRHELHQLDGLARGNPAYEQACGRITRSMFGAIRAIVVDCMVRGEDVEWEGFGRFHSTQRDGRLTRALPGKPRTDLEIVRCIKFKPSPAVKGHLQHGGTLPPRWYTRKATEALGAKTKRKRAEALKQKQELAAAAPTGILGAAVKRVGPHPNHKGGGRGIGRYRHLAPGDPFS